MKKVAYRFAFALVGLCLFANLIISTAAAQSIFVLEGPLEGLALEPHLEVFEDVSAELGIADVARVAGGDSSVEFAPVGAKTPNFGFSLSAAWLRFTVDNPGSESRQWLLEFAYPHVDQIELYVPDGHGDFLKRSSGDRLPFADRDLEYRNVVFRIQQPPGTATYYLRASSAGPLNLPLVAWSSETFLSHLNAQQPALWMFYGVMLALSLYNLFIYFSVRRIAYLYYVGYTLAYAAFQFVLNGLAFQYLWPESVWWANHCMPAAIAFGFVTGIQFLRHFLELGRYLPRSDRVLLVTGTYGGQAAAAVSLFIPYQYGIRVVIVVGTFVTCLMVASCIKIALMRHRAGYFVLIAWSMLLIGILLYLLKSMNMISANAATEWTIQIGASLESILLSLGLADRINAMRRDLQRLNGDLASNIDELQDALHSAEEAQRAKSEFLAGVSHELRTPLNSIINIPEGLLEDFEMMRAVRCTRCDSLFQLEDGEEPDLTMACPDCANTSSLTAANRYQFCGEANKSVGYLNQVVRSGNHLLEVVNDILDVSRLEAGQMSVAEEDVDMAELFDRVIAPMGGLADRQGVALHIQPLPDGCHVRGDATKLGQVFINLVGNAIKFSDGKGAVTVAVVEQDGNLLASVVDQGVGISATDKSRIFESFVQAEGGGTRRFGGSGLGLAITKKLVDLHHGKIWVESELGQGSTFWVRLPSLAGQICEEALLDESTRHESTPGSGGGSNEEG